MCCQIMPTVISCCKLWISTILLSSCYNPVRVCTAGLCVWSRQFVYVCIVCMYVCMYVCICGQKRDVWDFTIGKSPVSVIYCSLVEFNGQKSGLLCQVIHSGKKFGTILLMGWENGSGKLYYGKPHLV